MSEQPRVGDRVRVTYEGEYRRDVTGWQVIGVCPGTPAAEAQTPLPEWEQELLAQEAARSSVDPHKPVVLIQAQTPDYTPPGRDREVQP